MSDVIAEDHVLRETIVQCMCFFALDIHIHTHIHTYIYMVEKNRKPFLYFLAKYFLV